MKRSGLIALVFCVALFVKTEPVKALSCLPPVLNAEAIENAALIFEGTVLKALAEEEKTPGSMAQSAEYLFFVEKMWKGEPDKKEVKIKRGIYFGDRFALNQKYLIVAGKEDGDYTAPVCSNSVPIERAGHKIEILRRVYGD